MTISCLKSLSRGLALISTIVWIATCDSPLAPMSCGAIPQQTITVGESASVNGCFNDPNGDELAYRVWTSDDGVVEAVGMHGAVTVTAVGPGSALVTILATDGSGFVAEQSFTVLVPNRAPFAVGEIANREVVVGDSVTVDVSGYFSEPDGQPLSYSAASDASVISVAVVDATVSVMPVAKASRTVTLTATDPGGLVAVQSFMVTVPNRAPFAEGSVSEQTVEVGDTASMDISAYFGDLDGDPLTYAAESSDPVVLAVMVTDDMVSVMAVAKGAASVRVTATDNDGLTAVQSFMVTVPNRAPFAEGSVPEQTVEVGDTASMDISAYFGDLDGDPLTYAAESSDPAVLAVMVTDDMVSVMAVAKGAASVRVTATDTDGLTATQSFAVTVPNRPALPPNRPPIVTRPPLPQQVAVGETFVTNLAVHFSDPEDDALTFSASSSDPETAVVEVKGNTLEVRMLDEGAADIQVTAVDTRGNSVIYEFRISSIPNDPSRRDPPVVIARLPDRTLAPGGTLTADLGNYFHDPDPRDRLSYQATSSNDAVATATISGSTLHVTAVAAGSAAVTVTATDPESLEASLSFEVTVEAQGSDNRRPNVTEVIAFQNIRVQKDWTLDLSGHFSDPDGDALTFTAASSSPANATAGASGTELTVTGVAEGTTTITVTATDGGGLFAKQSFDVTVWSANSAPRPRAPLFNRTLVRGAVFNFHPHFYDDYDGTNLTFSVTSSNPAVATVEEARQRGLKWFDITALSEGAATISVSATDSDGLTTTLSFTVTVGNNAPRVAHRVPATSLPVGQVDTLVGGLVFEDADGGDALTYRATSSNAAIVSARVWHSGSYIGGDYIEITAKAVGEATVTLSARDLGGLTAEWSYAVTVDDDQPPYVQKEFPSDTVDVLKGDTLSYALADYFEDAVDGDALTYSASSSNRLYVSVEVSDGTLHCVALLGSGRAPIITVTAADTNGRTVSQSFRVRDQPRPSG